MSHINPWYQLGYVIPHLYTDMDAYQFYRVAPEGMMLVTTGLDLRDYTPRRGGGGAAGFLGSASICSRSKKVDRIAL